MFRGLDDASGSSFPASSSSMTNLSLFGDIHERFTDVDRMKDRACNQKLNENFRGERTFAREIRRESNEI